MPRLNQNIKTHGGKGQDPDAVVSKPLDDVVEKPVKESSVPAKAPAAPPAQAPRQESLFVDSAPEPASTPEPAPAQAAPARQPDQQRPSIESLLTSQPDNIRAALAGLDTSPISAHAEPVEAKVVNGPQAAMAGQAPVAVTEAAPAQQAPSTQEALPIVEEGPQVTVVSTAPTTERTEVPPVQEEEPATVETRPAAEKGDPVLDAADLIRNPILPTVGPDPLVDVVKPKPVRANRDLRAVTPTAQFKEVAQRVKDITTKLIGTMMPGSAVSEMMSSHPSVALDEVSVSVDMLAKAYLEPKSILREKLATDGFLDGYDQEALESSPGYLHWALMDYFSRNQVIGLCEKAPGTDEASAHTRRITVHEGPGQWIHPIVFAMWNADFDGDLMKVSFDPEAIGLAKPAMDFLIGTEREGKIDPSFVDWVDWRGTSDGDTIYAMLNKLLVTETTKPLPEITHAEMTGLAKALENIFEGNSERGYRALLRWARRISEASEVRPADSRRAARVINEIWEMNRDIRLNRYDQEAENREEWDSSKVEETALTGNEPESSRDPLYPGLISEAGLPASLTGVWRAEGSPIAATEDMNIFFRMGADRIKWARKENDFDAPYSTEATDDSDAKIALMMNGIDNLEEKTRRITDAARQRVFRKVGFPRDVIVNGTGEELRAWLNEFRFAFNREARVINAAGGIRLLDSRMTGHDSVSIREITDPSVDLEKGQRDLRTQFQLVFGTVTLVELFGEEQLKKAKMSRYANLTVDEFVHTNRISSTGNVGVMFNSVEQFLLSVADMRTSFASTYNNRLIAALGHMFTTFNGEKMTHLRAVMLAAADPEIGGQRPQHAMDPDIEAVARAFTLFGEDMFFALGLDSPAAFVDTELGSKILNAQTVDGLGGYLFEAVARHRMAPIQRYRDRVSEAMANTEKDGINRDDVLEDSQIKFEQELDRLASSSETWATIVMLYRNKQEGTVDPFADILFADVGMKAKIQKLNDLVRDPRNPVGRDFQKPYEIAAQLFADPTGLYARNRFMSDFGHSDMLANIKKPGAAIDRWAKDNWKACQEQVSDARKFYTKSPESAQVFTRFLETVRQDPRAFVTLEPWQMVDAILSSVAKTGKSGEKAKQEPEMSNSGYSAVGNLVNAGVWSDLAYGTDFLLRDISADRLLRTPGIWARLLTDPDFSIGVYDENGYTVLDQELLIGVKNPTNDQIWDFLESNPRVAMCLRTMTPGQSVDSKSGSSFLVADATIQDSIKRVVDESTNPSVKIRKRLADYPGFYSLIAMGIEMTGKTREQMRNPGILAVENVIRFLRSLPPGGVTQDYVEEMFAASGVTYADLSEVEETYQLGEKQRAESPIDPVGPEDVRDKYEYQVGKLIRRMTADINKYAAEIEEMGLSGLDPISAKAAAKTIFFLGDRETIGQYYDQNQGFTGAKTQLSTTINGGESKNTTGLAIIAARVAPDCGGGAPVQLDMETFEDEWEKYRSQLAVVPGPEGEPIHVPIDESTIDELLLSGLPVMTIENPAECLADCPCTRHATVDPSTRVGPGSTALGRLLTVVRTLSSEGLNLKMKTKGDDGKDSIVKMDVFELMKSDVRSDVQYAFENPEPGQSPIAAARTTLARAMKDAFGSLGYTEELTEADFINVAQMLIRVKRVEGQPDTITVLSLGRMNSIAKRAIRDVRRATEDGITHTQAIDAAFAALSDPEVLESPVDVAGLVARVRVQSQNKYFGAGLPDQRNSSIARNIKLVQRIMDENPDLVTLSEAQLDEVEAKLRKNHPAYFDKWKDYAGRIKKGSKFGEERVAYRITGVVTSEGFDIGQAKGTSFGPMNAWIIDAATPLAAKAIVRAYELGITVLIDGEILTQLVQGLDRGEDNEVSLFDLVAESIPELGEHQLVNLDEAKTSAQGGLFGNSRYLLPSFSIRLNGGNTTPRSGAYNVGTSHIPSENIHFCIEDPLNVYSLGDGEGAATMTFSNKVTPRRSGEYRLPMKAAFAGLLDLLRLGKRTPAPIFSDRAPVDDEIRVTVATMEDIKRDFLDPYLYDTEQGAPREFDRQMPIDTGTVLSFDDKSPEDVRFRRGVKRYLKRAGTLEDPTTSMLPGGEPDEIVGWLKAETADGQVRYHPIRLFEKGKHAAAPTSIDIKGPVMFDSERNELVVNWEHVGTMLGRQFKVFEGGAASNKSIMRPEPIADLTMKNGQKVSYVIAKQSTLKRRGVKRRQQKMMTLLYVARMRPYGYNLAEKATTMPDHKDLKELLLNDPEKATIGEWQKALGWQKGAVTTPIRFFTEPEKAQLNTFVNQLCEKAIRYGVNPTVVLASRFGGENAPPADTWFNFQILFDRGPTFQQNLMWLMHEMNPTLCPPDFNDTGDTFFNRDLQVLVPLPYTDRFGKSKIRDVWVDMFAGFHFMDEHYTGHSNTGARVRTSSVSIRNTHALGLREETLTPRQVDEQMAWGEFSGTGFDHEAFFDLMVSDDVEDDD